MSFHEILKSTFLTLNRTASDSRLLDYRSLLVQEANSWAYDLQLPPRRRLWLWRHGFTSLQGILYDFDRHDPKDYLSEYQRSRLYETLNGRHRYLLDDKLSQHWMLADHPDNRPKAFGLVNRGFVHGVAGTEYDGDPAPVSEWLPPALCEHSKLVLKQLRGLGGKEVRVCTYDGAYRLDESSLSEDALCETVEKLSDYLVTEFVNQHPYATTLYPHSANTIRVMTIWDEETGELHLPAAVHRIGTDQSRPIDNWSTGGLSADIDVETGEIGRAARYPFSGDVEWYTTHPDTGVQIEGASVPNWEHVRSTVQRIALDNTNVPVVGWDIIVDESGTPVVIEANTGTGVELLQVHQPLLNDSRTAELIERYV